MDVSRSFWCSLFAVLFLGCIGFVPSKSFADLNGDWTGSLKYTATGASPVSYSNCEVKIVETPKSLLLTYESKSCEMFNTSDGPFDIVFGNLLFLNGFYLGNLTKNSFVVDFTDFSQGYVAHFKENVSIAKDGSLHLTQSLQGGGYADSLTGTFIPSHP